MIPKETISLILETARIEEVIGDFVKLKRSGSNYKGLSPFTNEKNPSFYVSPGKGMYKCFSSGKGGNVVNFLMEHEHFTYPEALRYLAKRYKIEIQEEEQTPEELEALNEKESLFHVTAFAQKYFSEQLFETEKGKAVGLSYFKEREFRDETIKKFQLGYSPENWEAFTREAISQGYKLEYLEKTGLTIVREDRSYDRFRGRVIFPIHNISGRVVGFGARTLLKDDNIPKYLNSPESAIYNKSQVLYGLYFARNEIIRRDNCYLVEGYTDVLSMHQAGIENVVASSGTSLTEDQIKLIQRYTKNITILYDGDPAGIAASSRGIDMVLEAGMNVRVVLFPDDEDPDSFVRKHRRTDVEEYITKGATDFIKFRTKVLQSKVGSDPIKRAELIRNIVGSISLVPDAIFRSVYVKECSILMDVPEQALLNELNKMLRQRYRKKYGEEEASIVPETTEYTAPKQVETDPLTLEYQERDLIRLILMYGNNDLEFEEEDEFKKIETRKVPVARYVIGQLSEDHIRFQNQIYQSILDIVSNGVAEHDLVDENTLLKDPDNALGNEVAGLITSPYELSDNWIKQRITVVSEKEKLKQAVIHTILSLKARMIDRNMMEIQLKIKDIEDEEEMNSLMSKLKLLKEISMKINAELGRVVTR